MDGEENIKELINEFKIYRDTPIEDYKMKEDHEKAYKMAFYKLVKMGGAAVPYLIEVLNTKESVEMQKDAVEALMGIADRIIEQKNFIKALEKIKEWNDSLRESKTLSEERRRVIKKFDRITGETLDEKHFGGSRTTDESPGRFKRLRI